MQTVLRIPPRLGPEPVPHKSSLVLMLDLYFSTKQRHSVNLDATSESKGTQEKYDDEKL